MKHLKHLFTALLLLCSTLVAAHDFEVGGVYYNILSGMDKTVEVTCRGTSYNDYSNEYTGSVVIPESVTYNGTTYIVTSIGESAFSYCDGLTSVVIPNCVTSIGMGAFSGCTGLTSVEIPNSVTSIGKSAFYKCYGLTSIEIPNSVISIGDIAFNSCTGLTNISVAAGNAKYDSRDNCNAIIETATNKLVFGCKNTVIPNRVTSIGDRAFRGCTGLTSIKIPNSVTSIGLFAFSGCSGLTSVTSHIRADALFAVNTNVFNGVDKNSCTLYVPYGAKETYASTEGWSAFTNIVELEPTATEVTVNINQYGCATYCSPYALDFSEVEGLKAYSAIGYKPSTQVVTLARVMTTGAGQGVFVKGEPGEYTVPVIDNFDEYTLNMLVGTLEQTTVNSTDGAMSNYKFTIADGDAAPMFYPFEDGTTLSAGKAYLQIPTAWLPVTAQKSLSVRFDDGETTDIDEVKGEDGKVKGVCYDMQGRVVENPTSGIYIIDGKKVVIK